MVATNEISALPKTLAEFILWRSEDGFKYEWNDGEIIKFTGMNKKQLYIYEALNNLFIEKGFWKIGTFVAEYDTMLSGIQMRRPESIVSYSATKVPIFQNPFSIKRLFKAS